jgi:AcrR family transcriptional regulator
MAKTPPPPDSASGRDAAGVRARILDAAFDAFMKRGYAATSTLEIATSAHVSKRELYALVGNKQEILAACISARASRMQAPDDLPAPDDRASLEQLLTAFGTRILREITDPTVVAVFRLAIAEAVNAPEVARAVDEIGREGIRAALRQIMARALSAGLLAGTPADLAAQFGELLWGSVMVGLLLGVAERPSPRDAAARAREAVTTFLLLHPPSDESVHTTVRRPRSSPRTGAG